MVHDTQFADDMKKELIVHPSDHGGESETSCVMALRPDLVRTEKQAANPFGKLAVESLENVFFIRPWHLYVPESAGGDTSEASAEKGRRILEASIDGLAALICELDSVDITDKFPYA